MSRPFYLLGEMGKGGQEAQLQNLLNTLCQHQVSCGLIIWTTNAEYQYAIDYLLEKGVKILSLPQTGFRIKISTSLKFIKAHKPTSLHSFTFYLNFYTWLLGLLSGVPAIGGLRNRLAIMLQVSGVGKYILCSAFPRKKISNNVRFRKGFRFPLTNWCYKSTKIVVNQMDIEKYSPVNLNLTAEIQTISMSRLFEEKDIPTLIAALAIVKASGVSFHHKHAGKGPLLDQLKLKIADAGLESCFTFIGEVKDSQKFFHTGEVFLHSSLFEGFPNVIMEAMACGLPIVTTRCGDAEDLVEENVNGYCVDAGDPNVLAAKIIELLKDQDKIISFAQNSYKLAKNRFKLDRLMYDTFNAYKEFNIPYQIK